MLIHYDPDEFKPTVETRTCGWHQVNPGKPYAGCTCGTTFGSVRRSLEEVRAIKEERQRKEEDDILRRAKAIKLRRRRLTK